MKGQREYWQRFWERRLSRRRALRGAALGGASLAVAAVVGCAREEKPAGGPAAGPEAPATPATKLPRRGGILVHEAGGPVSQDVVGAPFDPHGASPRAAHTHRLVFQGLLGHDLITNEPQPDLAQSWEQPSPTEYIFNLHPGIKWQNKPPVNGRELRVEDVTFSLDRARTDKPQFVSRSAIAMVDKIEAADKTRVRITTKRPDASTLSALGADPFLIMAPEVVERANKFATPEEVVGTGPFILKSIQIRVAGEYLRNPDYWKPGLPYLDGVRTQFFADGETAFAAFLAGGVHVVQVPGIHVGRYLAQRGPNYSPLWFKDDTIFLAMPNLKVKPLNDPRVTKALRLFIDHHEFISAWAKVQNGRGTHGSIFPASLDNWDVPQGEYSKHPFWKQSRDEAVKEARALLAAAGFTPSGPLRLELLTMNSPSPQAGGELLQAQWKRLGQGIVEAQLKLFDTATVNALAARRDFTYAFYPTSAPVSEPSAWLNQLWRSGGSRNLIGLADPKLDDIIDRQSGLFDARQRKPLVQDIARYMMENSPGVPGANLSLLNGVDARVRSFAPERFLKGRQYEWVWLDT